VIFQDLTPVFRGLRSQKLALGLLVATAVVAIFGTFAPVQRMELFYRELIGSWFLQPARFFGLVDTYRSPFFILLLILLSLNLLLCSWNRFSRWRTSARRSGGGPERRSRNAAKRVLDLMLHLSVVVILAGGVVKGLWSFVGTQNIYVGGATLTAYDWRLETDASLGFSVLVKDMVEEFYPLRAKIGVGDAATQRKLALVEVQEGVRTRIPDSESWIEVSGFDRTSGVMKLTAEAGGRRETLSLESRPGGVATDLFEPFSLTLVAFRQDLKTVRSLIALRDGEGSVKEQWLAPNARIGYKGTSMYQTAWGRDENGKPYVGIQFIRDPGAPFFWVGSVLFSLVLPVFLVIRQPRQKEAADGVEKKAQ